MLFAGTGIFEQAFTSYPIRRSIPNTTRNIHVINSSDFSETPGRKFYFVIVAASVLRDRQHSYLPSYGEQNLTPLSVISASSSRDTIWKPPESVSSARGHPMKPWRPPNFCSNSAPCQIIGVCLINGSHV